MSAPLVESLVAWQALDSRGSPTIAVSVRLSSGHEGRALAPSGASVGTLEAKARRSANGSYGSEGVEDAIAQAEAVAKRLVGTIAEPRSVDDELAQADGTEQLGSLGANTCVAISLAVAIAAAAATGKELYQYLSAGGPISIPLPMVNVFSGGRHAAGLVDFQDFLVVPLAARDFAEAIATVWHVRRAAAAEAERRGHSCALVADEGGFGVPFNSNREAVEVLITAIESAGLEPGVEVAIALDVAGNQLWNGDRYSLATEGRDLDGNELIAEFGQWLDDYSAIVSIEDLLHDQDVTGWEEAMKQLGDRVQLLGDDLFATSESRVVEARGLWANAILIKPNQAGLLTRAKAAMVEARAMGMTTVVSARSGDTEDTWLADLAVGWSADQIKVGSLTRSERTAKWNRLLEIERRDSTIDYVGATGLQPKARRPQ